MDIDRMQQLAVDALEDVKGKDIVVINTESLSPMFERIVIASGQSTRQVKALADNVADRLRTAGVKPIGLEGEQNCEWVLVDFGALVVHVMLPEIRDYYRLEEIWRTQPDPRFQAQYQDYRQNQDNA